MQAVLHHECLHRGDLGDVGTWSEVEVEVEVEGPRRARSAGADQQASSEPPTGPPGGCSPALALRDRVGDDC